MKELIHFTLPESTVCKEMSSTIDSFIKHNPEILYTKIDVSSDSALYEFYSKRYEISTCPAFLGLVDGKVHDGHCGKATELILESLVS
jgi:hypothetical protein